MDRCRRCAATGWRRSGWLFKDGTDDIRESPAIARIELLLKEGYDIRAYDPAAMERAREVLPGTGMSYASSLYEAATGCDVLLILTDWAEFATFDLPGSYSRRAGVPHNH